MAIFNSYVTNYRRVPLRKRLISFLTSQRPVDWSRRPSFGRWRWRSQLVSRSTFKGNGVVKSLPVTPSHRNKWTSSRQTIIPHDTTIYLWVKFQFQDIWLDHFQLCYQTIPFPGTPRQGDHPSHGNPKLGLVEIRSERGLMMILPIWKIWVNHG